MKLIAHNNKKVGSIPIQFFGIFRDIFDTDLVYTVETAYFDWRSELVKHKS